MTHFKLKKYKISDQETEFLRESNAIEGVYDDDSLQQAVKAWRYLLRQNKLSVLVILKTHAILMLNQSISVAYKGKFRTEPVWVGGREGMNWKDLPMAMALWCNQTQSLTSKLSHIQFEKIHPFIDGNGRVGRMLMNWQHVKSGKPILIIKQKDRYKYYEWFRENKTSDSGKNLY